MAGWYPYGSYRHPAEHGPYPPPPYQAGYGVGSPLLFPNVPNTSNGSYGLSNSPYAPPVLPPVAPYPPVQYSNNYNAFNNQQYIPYPVQYVGAVMPQIDGSTTSRPAIDPSTAFFHCAYPGCVFFSEHQSDIVHHWKVHFPPYEPASCSSRSCRHKKRHAIEQKERLHEHIGKILGKPK